MLNSGERQVSPTLEGIRKDHTARYRFVADMLKGLSIIDCACGIGYGAKIMADAGCTVKAIDIDEEAIAYAGEHYQHKNITYVQSDAYCIGPFNPWDAIVSFETIEHVKDPLTILKRFARCARTLIVSVPNESVFPYDKRYKYHERHYTAQQFEELLNKAGWEVESWWGQEGKESELLRDTQGRTLTVIAKQRSDPLGETWKSLPEPPKAPPESVAIVAMGHSAGTYMRLASLRGGRQKMAQETWAINSMGNIFEHDLLFQMDDLKIQEARAKRNPDGNVAGMLEWLKDHPNFITSRAYPDYPGGREFPLADVWTKTGHGYFNNTVAYAVAYAVYIGVKKISMWGADYSYDNNHKAESGRGCVEFWLGLASAKGIHLEVAGDTSLLDANVPDNRKFYGYDTQDLEIEMNDNGVIIHKKDREEIPTAEDIEIRYKHEQKK